MLRSFARLVPASPAGTPSSGPRGTVSSPASVVILGRHSGPRITSGTTTGPWITPRTTTGPWISPRTMTGARLVPRPATRLSISLYPASRRTTHPGEGRGRRSRVNLSPPGIKAPAGTLLLFHPSPCSSFLLDPLPRRFHLLTASRWSWNCWSPLLLPECQEYGGGDQP